MTEFISKVKRTITRHGLLRPKGRIIVAVSGGADSVALLSALLDLGYDCAAAHCNFHLRGEESNRDMRHVECLTERLDVDLYVKEFDVFQRVKDTGESLEMACRELRYKWFFDLLDRDSAQAIAVGHHREDQVETFFLNLMRGSGLAGLAGMRHRAEHVVRPLLDVSRKEIEQYVTDKGLAWITDSSNASDDFARNRLRNRLLPVLEEFFPGAHDSILRSMAILRENEAVYTLAAKEHGERYLNRATGEVDLAALTAGEAYPGAILFEMLKSEGFNRRQVDDMLTAAAHSGGTFRSGTTHVRDVDHSILRAPHAGTPLSADAVDITLTRDIFYPVHIEVTRHNVAEFRPEGNPAIAYIDEASLTGNHRWQLRHWRRGDRMIPYGMKGSKLVSDIFADAHLSARQKAETWLLTCDDKIVWTVGLRASGHFTVGPSTRTYLRLALQTGSEEKI